MGRMKDVFIQMRAEEYEGDVNTYVKKYAEELNSIKYFCTQCFSTVIETVIKHNR